jgi:hypothetical protein
MRYPDFRALLVVGIAASVTACSDSGTLAVVESLPNQGAHTPHTDIDQGIWPPQPLGMSNEQPLPASAMESARGNVINAARSIVMNNPAVRQVLGDDYIEFDGSLGESKSDVTASFLFFSYSSNETVEVELLRSGEVVSQTYAAFEFQPTEQAAEVERAIALADAALNSAGFATDGLTGTAMLAFPRASDDTDNGQQFYPERVLYVTFGEGDGELPAYSALANLSTGTVSEEGLIQ